MKRICVFTFLLSIISLSYGQWIDGRNFLGLGLSYSSIHANYFKTESRPGWNTCFGANIETLNDFDLIITVGLGTMGATVPVRESDGMTLKPDYTDYKFNFMSITNAYQISYRVIDPTLRLNAGLCMGIQGMFSKLKDEHRFYIGDSDLLSENIDAGAMFNKMGVDFGLTGGISGGTEEFEIALSYIFYLSNLCREVDFSNTRFSARNGVLELKFQYYLDFM